MWSGRPVTLYSFNRYGLNTFREFVIRVYHFIDANVPFGLSFVGSVPDIPVRASEIILKCHPFYLQFYLLPEAWVAEGYLFDDAITSLFQTPKQGNRSPEF